MSTLISTIPTARMARAASRTSAMSRAEMRLLLRNKTAMFTALAMPVLMALFIASVAEFDGLETGAALVTTLLAMILLLVVYYNLVTAYVARREELVLKRLRTSEATDREILTATAVPALAIGVSQLLVGLVAAAVLLDLGMPVNPLLLVVAVLGGGAVFIVLAAASTAFTRTAEMAQVTTMPMLIIGLMFSGVAFPLDVLPDAAANAARLIPLTPVVELTQLGLHGAVGDAAPTDFAGTFGAALVPVVLLAMWVSLGIWAVRRWFRWEPRH